MVPGEKIALENLDQLINQHMAFLIRTVSNFTGKYVSIENDDEFSIALIAFTEAVKKYDEDELYKVLLTKGYPKELCAEIAYKNLNTDYTATRMLGYLYRYTEPRLEDVIDEMIAILSDREEIIKKKEMEQAQAVINEIYRNGL